MSNDELVPKMAEKSGVSPEYWNLENYFANKVSYLNRFRIAGIVCLH